MGEISAYNSLRRRVRRGHWVRFENRITPGIPDALAVVDGVYTWLEAKELYGTRATWKVSNLRPEQLLEIFKLRRVGGRVYLLLHRPRHFWLVDANQENLSRLRAGITPEELAELAVSVEEVFPTQGVDVP